MIKNIKIINEDNIFNWVLNVSKFKKKYPEIYEDLKVNLSDMDYWEIIEIIPREDNIEDITIKTESVILDLLDGSEQKIFNTLSLIC